MRFGDSEFEIVVEGFELFPEVKYSQLKLRFEGADFGIAGEAWETFAVVVPSLVEFGRNGDVRHWGAFGGVSTIDEMLERVDSYVYSGVDRYLPWHWDVVSGLRRYDLSGLFDANLGVGRAIAVRGHRQETIIVQSLDGTVRAYDVPVKSFDRAIDGLAEWMRAVQA